jgi:hypothetical protein
MSKVREEILPPEVEHGYNNPNLNSKEFLTEIMHDKKVPLNLRMEAARNLAPFEHPRLAQVNQDLTAGVTIRIEGGLPELPGTNIIMPKQGSVLPSEVPARKGNGSDSV